MHGAAQDARHLHPGPAHVGGEHRLARDDPRAVDALAVAADQPELRLRLEARRGRHGETRGVRGQRAIARGASARRVAHASLLRAARGRVHLPARRRGGDEHLPRRRARRAQRQPHRPGAPAAVGPEVGEVGAGLRLHELDRVRIDLELLGEDDGQRRPRALPHLRLADGQGDLAGRVDPDPRVRTEVRARRGSGLRLRRAIPGEAEAEREAARRDGADLEELPPRRREGAALVALRLRLRAHAAAAAPRRLRRFSICRPPSEEKRSPRSVLPKPSARSSPPRSFPRRPPRRRGYPASPPSRSSCAPRAAPAARRPARPRAARRPPGRTSRAGPRAAPSLCASFPSTAAISSSAAARTAARSDRAFAPAAAAAAPALHVRPVEDLADDPPAPADLQEGHVVLDPHGRHSRDELRDRRVAVHVDDRRSGARAPASRPCCWRRCARTTPAWRRRPSRRPCRRRTSSRSGGTPCASRRSSRCLLLENSAPRSPRWRLARARERNWKSTGPTPARRRRRLRRRVSRGPLSGSPFDPNCRPRSASPASTGRHARRLYLSVHNRGASFS